eukprot:363993-Chlamydomonas_euryale.AAC.7
MALIASGEPAKCLASTFPLSSCGRKPLDRPLHEPLGGGRQGLRCSGSCAVHHSAAAAADQRSHLVVIPPLLIAALVAVKVAAREVGQVGRVKLVVALLAPKLGPHALSLEVVALLPIPCAVLDFVLKVPTHPMRLYTAYHIQTG